VPIIPPSLAWKRTAVSRVADVVTSAKTSLIPPPNNQQFHDLVRTVSDAMAEFAPADQSLSPSEPQDRWAGVDCDAYGRVVQIFYGLSIAELKHRAQYYFDAFGGGERSFRVCENVVAGQLRVGDRFTEAQLRIMSGHLERCYQLMSIDGGTERSLRQSVRSRVIVGAARTDIEIEQNGLWIPFSKWWQGKGKRRG
jgi:hypothetical protein